MDPYAELDNEMKKIDVRRLLEVFAEEEREDYLPLLKAEVERECNEFPDSDWVRVTSKAIQMSSGPNVINFSSDFVQKVKNAIEDAILCIVSDVIKDLFHGYEKGIYRGWKELTPYNLLMAGGAELVDPEAKTALSEVVEEIGGEIAKNASEFARYAGRKIVFPEDVKMSAKRYRKQVNISEERLRALIRGELDELKKS